MEMRDRLGRKMFSERSHVFGISKSCICLFQFLSLDRKLARCFFRGA